jgi:hypothetical protein
LKAGAGAWVRPKKGNVTTTTTDTISNSDSSSDAPAAATTNTSSSTTTSDPPLSRESSTSSADSSSSETYEWNESLIKDEWRSDRMLSSLLTRRRALPGNLEELRTTLERLKAESPEYQAMSIARDAFEAYQHKIGLDREKAVLATMESKAGTWAQAAGTRFEDTSCL